MSVAAMAGPAVPRFLGLELLYGSSDLCVDLKEEGMMNEESKCQCYLTSGRRNVVGWIMYSVVRILDLNIKLAYVLFEHQCRGAACAVSWGHMHRPASSNLCLLTATG
jgi:hypothetical protein